MIFFRGLELAIHNFQKIDCVDKNENMNGERGRERVLSVDV